MKRAAVVSLTFALVVLAGPSADAELIICGRNSAVAVGVGVVQIPVGCSITVHCDAPACDLIAQMYLRSTAGVVGGTLTVGGETLPCGPSALECQTGLGIQDRPGAGPIPIRCDITSTVAVFYEMGCAAQVEPAA